VTDPWLSRQQANDATWVELDRYLSAVVEAAVAEVLAKLWRLVLGERVLTAAAAQPPNLDGAEQAARETWAQALQRWVRPVAYAYYQRQYDQAAAGEPGAVPARARDAWWADTLDRVEDTADRIVEAVRDTIRESPSDSIEQLRDKVAATLSLDAPAASIREEIAATEQRLAALGRSTSAQQSDLYARKVRLQAELFRIEASRARSQAYQALADVQPDDAEQFRDLARQSARSTGDVDRVKRELAGVDEQLFKAKKDPTPDEADEIARLARQRQHLHGTLDEADETWRNTALRIARTESTNVLNEATLQRGIDMQDDAGEELIKVWISADDARTRPSHARGTGVHGQTQPLDQPFRVGVSVDGEIESPALLMRPGDPDGPLDEVIQCRCSIVVLTRAEHEEIASVLASTTPTTPTEWFEGVRRVLAADGWPSKISTAEFAEMELTAATELLEETVTVPDLEALPPLQWHGVITVEEVYTGDRRKFTAGSLRTQPLPMPLRWARTDFGGHDGAIVVGNIEGVRRYAGQIRAWGTFADGTLTPEVDELQGLMATRMMRGISIDGDDILDSDFQVEIDADGNLFEVYTSARLRSSTLVAIPAYDEAEVFLGPAPAGWALEGEPVFVGQNEPETRPVEPVDLDALVADAATVENRPDYWALPGQEGAARIAWGTPGDYPRCREALAPYVSPVRLSAVCANLQYLALGEWPGRTSDVPLLAATDGTGYTVEDFEPWEGHEHGPGPGGVTPITITDDGHVYGTVAPWKACHTGFSDVCVPPPRSNTNYGYFHTGGVKLADGTVLPIGKLTSTAGHASKRSSAQAAMAHYDDTSTTAAIVRAFENKVGIQVRGVVLSTATEEQIADLLASPLSGDWRPVREGMEMIAAHCVNSQGFTVMRESLAASGGWVADSIPLYAEVGMVDGKQTCLIAGVGPWQWDEQVQAIAAAAGMDPVSRAARIQLPALAGFEIDARVSAVVARTTSKEA
jgi:hypothetical protein